MSLPRRWHVTQEIDELFKIFRVLGTPNEGTWPGVSQFADFKDTFPKWDRLPWRVSFFLGAACPPHTLSLYNIDHTQLRYSTMLWAQTLQNGIMASVYGKHSLSSHVCYIDMCAVLYSWLTFAILPFTVNKLPSQDDNLLVQDMVPSLEPLGLDLLSQMLRYEPQKRITARAAVKHPYFSDVAQMFAQRILVA